jgi:hypothetical protein
MISQWLRCAGEASLSRQDHANGTLITRPSTKRNVIRSSVTETSFTRASVLTAVFTPCLLNPFSVFLNNRSDSIDLPGRESVVCSQR